MKRIVGSLLLLLLFLLFAPGHWITWSYPFSPLAIGSILRGEISAEIGQDIVGFQRMAAQEDPYLLLEGELIGANEPLVTTHPPTAFLLTAPVALLPLNTAVALWAWSMLIATAVSLRLFGSDWPSAIGITVLSILWLPTAGSLGQLTPFWLLGCACAYHYRNRSPFAAGVFIALASLTKYLPAIFMGIFFLRKKWMAFLGFALVWMSALTVILLISPDAITQMIQSNQSSLVEHSLRSYYSSLLSSAYITAGWVGILIVLVLLTLIAISNRSKIHLEPEISPTTWHLVSYFSVVLLPICWFYSLFPLLPTALWLMEKGGRHRISAWLFLIIPPYFPIINLVVLAVGLIGTNSRVEKKVPMPASA